MNLHMIWLQNNKLFNEVNDSQFSDCTYVVDIDLVHNINWIYIYIMYCMHNIKHIQIFALNWHITHYVCECIYIYTDTSSVFNMALSTKQHVYFKLLFAPWSVRLFKTTRLASVSWINSLSSSTTCSRVAGTGFCWFGALGVGNGNLNQTWLIFENRNAGMNWDTSMMTDVYGIERCHCSYSLVKKLFETTWDITVFNNSTRWPTWKCWRTEKILIIVRAEADFWRQTGPIYPTVDSIWHMKAIQWLEYCSMFNS